MGRLDILKKAGLGLGGTLGLAGVYAGYKMYDSGLGIDPSRIKSYGEDPNNMLTDVQAFIQGNYAYDPETGKYQLGDVQGQAIPVAGGLNTAVMGAGIGMGALGLGYAGYRFRKPISKFIRSNAGLAAGERLFSYEGAAKVVNKLFGGNIGERIASRTKGLVGNRLPGFGKLALAGAALGLGYAAVKDRLNENEAYGRPWLREDISKTDSMLTGALAVGVGGAGLFGAMKYGAFRRNMRNILGTGEPAEAANQIRIAKRFARNFFKPKLNLQNPIDLHDLEQAQKEASPFNPRQFFKDTLRKFKGPKRRGKIGAEMTSEQMGPFPDAYVRFPNRSDLPQRPRPTKSKFSLEPRINQPPNRFKKVFGTWQPISDTTGGIANSMRVTFPTEWYRGGLPTSTRQLNIFTPIKNAAKGAWNWYGRGIEKGTTWAWNAPDKVFDWMSNTGIAKAYRSEKNIYNKYYKFYPGIEGSPGYPGKYMLDVTKRSARYIKGGLQKGAIKAGDWFSGRTAIGSSLVSDAEKTILQRAAAGGIPMSNLFMSKSGFGLKAGLIGGAALFGLYQAQKRIPQAGYAGRDLSMESFAFGGGLFNRNAIGYAAASFGALPVAAGLTLGAAGVGAGAIYGINKYRQYATKHNLMEDIYKRASTEAGGREGGLKGRINRILTGETNAPYTAGSQFQKLTLRSLLMPSGESSAGRIGDYMDEEIASMMKGGSRQRLLKGLGSLRSEGATGLGQIYRRFKGRRATIGFRDIIRESTQTGEPMTEIVGQRSKFRSYTKEDLYGELRDIKKMGREVKLNELGGLTRRTAKLAGMAKRIGGVGGAIFGGSLGYAIGAQVDVLRNLHAYVNPKNIGQTYEEPFQIAPITGAIGAVGGAAAFYAAPRIIEGASKFAGRTWIAGREAAAAGGLGGRLTRMGKEALSTGRKVLRKGGIFAGLAAGAAVFGGIPVASMGLSTLTGVIASKLEAYGAGTQLPNEVDLARVGSEGLPMSYAQGNMDVAYKKMSMQGGPMSPNHLSSQGVGLAAYNKRKKGWI